MGVDIQVTWAWCERNLQKAKRKENDFAEACCPLHEDRTPSLSVNLRTAWVKCYAGCIDAPLKDLAQRSGLPAFATDEQMRATKPMKKRTEYIYLDEARRPHAKVVRYDSFDGRGKPDKTISQERVESGFWVKKAPRRRILYRLPELIQAPRGSLVVWGEGEKVVEEARKMDLLATTSPQGSGSFSKLDRSCLKALEGQFVFILPDNDGNGRAYANEVLEALRAVGVDARILDLTSYWPQGIGVPDGADLVDWTTAIIAAANPSEAPSIKWAGGRLREILNTALRVDGSIQEAELPSADEWQEPLPLDALPPGPTFPIECLPKWLGQYVWR